MAKVMTGRYTAQIDEPFVVFLIGMRINKWFAFSKWIPTARAMGPMLRTLFQHPEKGFLGGQVFFYWRGIALVQQIDHLRYRLAPLAQTLKRGKVTLQALLRILREAL